MKTEATPTKTEFKFNCPTCGQHILVASQWSGLGISCPSCQRRITVPALDSDERLAQPAMPPNNTGRTIRIELPLNAGQSAARTNGGASANNPASAVTPTGARIENSQRILGNEPWSDLVRNLEKGTLVAPADLATALFHELMDVRRRLDRLENRTTQKTKDGDGDLVGRQNHDSMPERTQ